MAFLWFFYVDMSGMRSSSFLDRMGMNIAGLVLPIYRTCTHLYSWDLKVKQTHCNNSQKGKIYVNYIPHNIFISNKCF